MSSYTSYATMTLSHSTCCTHMLSTPRSSPPAPMSAASSSTLHHSQPLGFTPQRGARPFGRATCTSLRKGSDSMSRFQIQVCEGWALLAKPPRYPSPNDHHPSSSLRDVVRELGLAVVRLLPPGLAPLGHDGVVVEARVGGEVVGLDVVHVGGPGGAGRTGAVEGWVGGWVGGTWGGHGPATA